MKLTPKQELFITEYMANNLNATEAYKKAYGVINDDTARANASRLIANANIKKEIDKRLEQVTLNAGVTPEMVIKEIAKVGFANITDYLKVDDFEYINGYEKDEEGNLDFKKPIKKVFRSVEVFKTDDIPLDKIAAVGEIRQTKDGISLKMHDKLKALEMLGRNLKLFTEKIESENTNNNFNKDVSEMTDAELEEELKKYE